MTDMVPVAINGRADWTLRLPDHRAARREWSWWEATRLAAMASRIGPDDVVWDVGAEEGDLPALWALWGADVVLAEPNPRVWPNIRAIFHANALPDPLLCWPGFFGDEATHPEAAFPDGWPDCADGPVIGDHGFLQLGERPDVPTTTIDRAVAAGHPPPTVITIDVEGAELHVLRGAAATLADDRPDVFCSVHPTFMRHHYNLEPEDLEAYMGGLDYEQVFLTEDHERHEWWVPKERMWPR